MVFDYFMKQLLQILYVYVILIKSRLYCRIMYESMRLFDVEI